MTPSSIENQKPQRQRKRVPISCLNCKKRKVKCDKVKPACGGCVRNGVAHLCEYLDPHWTQSESSNGFKEGSSEPAKAEVVPIETTETYKQLKLQNEKVINTQRKEIEDLKRQLSVVQQFSPKNHDSIPHNECTAITILGKLSTSTIKNRDYLEVINDPTFLVIPKKSTSNNYVDTYSWINLIKLDPQLTALWFKITNLQKIYHVYKMNLLKANSPSNVNQNNNNNNNNNNNSLTNKSVTTNPLSKKSPYRINEIDFTFSAGSPFKVDDQRCPVIECDFNFMTEDTITPSPHGSNSPYAIVKSIDKPKFSKSEEDQMAEHEIISEKGKSLLIRLQNIWDSTLNLVRGNEKLNYKQLYFLIDFYFNNQSYDIESRDLLSFYKVEIQSTIKKSGNEIALNLSNGGGGQKTDAELYVGLKMKGVYLSMLALIIEESLEILRSNVKLNLSDDISMKFNNLFPAEIIYIGVGSRSANMVFIVQEFVVNLLSPKASDEVAVPSLGIIACTITVLNREISEYKKYGASSDPKSGFSSLFTSLLKLLLDDESMIELWKDPELIAFRDDESRRKSKDLKIHLCYLWSDLVRIANLSAFNFVPLIKHSERLDKSLKLLYEKIEEADSVMHHLKYITSLNSEKYDELTISLHVHYLIARVSSALCHGISKVGDPKLTISNLDALIRQCSTWLVDLGLRKLRYIRRFEVDLILNYLRYFMKYIILLQAEETMDHEMVNTLIPDIFIKYLQYVDHIRKILLSESDSINTQYVLSAITEVITRLIQFVISFLIRLRNDDNVISQETILRIAVLKAPASINTKVISDYGVGLNDLINTHIVDVVDDTVALLFKGPLLDKEKASKLSKLWKFYLSFVTNSQKMGSINYAQIHANVPLFKGLQNDAKSCPVIKNDHHIISSEVDGYPRCPISHITTPMEDSPTPALKYPSINSDSSISPKQEIKKRRCPFDHTTMGGKSSLAPNYNPMESNIRGESVRKRPALAHKLSDSFTQSLTASPVPQIKRELSVMPPPQMPMSIPMPFDTQVFTDFDLDFLQNENLLEQINFPPGAELDHIEGFFQ
ncbi:fungal transcriptional regulatory protein [Scheffersomyces coipomensis]|uniref:fungal transcriptional regulatory protein n=1 Tax=Scheffersomyces coipomensis TaxID=1788519 RepID=UPI00315D0063